MSDTTPAPAGDRQDPENGYRLDQAVETEEQPMEKKPAPEPEPVPVVEVSPDSEQDAAPVEVSPAEPVVENTDEG